jgi:hypothetical protein
MKIDILAIADALSDRDLIARLGVLAGNERASTVELVAHLAALDARPALYAAEGYGSLFTYCTQALRLSEDAACNRIAAARACRRFPVILDRLATGEVSLTSVRLLSPHLTPGNHQAVLARARCRRHDKLRRVQALLCREIPDGDPAAIFDRALTLLLEKVEKRKLGATTRPRPGRSIRSGTDKRSRPTIENISLRCRRHNQYEAELIFGAHGTSLVRESAAYGYRCASPRSTPPSTARRRSSVTGRPATFDGEPETEDTKSAPRPSM